MATKTKKTEKQEALPSKASVPVQGGKFARVGAVSTAQLKLVDDVPVYVKITNPIDTQAKKKGGVMEKDENGDPRTIDILRVVNLETGEVQTMVSGKALSQRLKEYKGGNDQYVGLCFEITKKDNGRRWKEYLVYEIDGTKAGEGKV